MRIGIDMDGVLCDLTASVVEKLNRYHGESLTVEDITQYDFHHNCKTATREDVFQYFCEPGFFRHLLPLPGAVENVNKLIDDGHEIIIISACRTGMECKLQWLKNHIPRISEKDCIFTWRKDLVDVDILIEDHGENLIKWTQHWNQYSTAMDDHRIGILIDQPYNREYENFLRYTHWDFVYGFISNLDQSIQLVEEYE